MLGALRDTEEGCTEEGETEEGETEEGCTDEGGAEGRGADDRAVVRAGDEPAAVRTDIVRAGDEDTGNADANDPADEDAGDVETLADL